MTGPDAARSTLSRVRAVVTIAFSAQPVVQRLCHDNWTGFETITSDGHLRCAWQPPKKGACKSMPALGVSLFLIAVGAVLAFAVSATVSGIDVQTIGVILLGVGFLGILMSMLFLMSFSPFGNRDGDGPTRHIDVH